MMKSALTAEVSRSLKVTLKESPTTDTAAIKASPTVSATAVADVRCGLRAAFLRAIWPVMVIRGVAIVETIGSATNGLIIATAMNTAAAPAPRSDSCREPVPISANRPASDSAAPSAATTIPTYMRVERCLFEVDSAESSRSPAIGDVRDALIAGTKEAISVIITPSVTVTITVRGVRGRSPAGSDAPSAENNPRMPTAPSIPSAIPVITALTPITKASSRTDLRT